MKSLTDEPENIASPSASRGGQDVIRNLLAAMVSNSKEACTVIRSLAPARRWELEREVIGSYQAVVLRMNTLLRSCTCPPDRRQRVLDKQSPL